MLKKSIETTEKLCKSIEEMHNNDIKSLSAETDDLKMANLSFVETNTALQTENKQLAADIDAKQSTISALANIENGLSARISDLTSKEVSLLDAVGGLEGSVNEKQAELDVLQSSISTKQVQIDTEISAHEQKKQIIKQDIVEMQMHDEKVRSDLATWQQKLQDWDKNLRVRELKATQKEESITRNYDLLNL